MLTTKQFIEAAQRGEIDPKKVQVIVDNDCIDAYVLPEQEDGEHIKLCNFDDGNPEEVLVQVLQTLGINAERA